MDQVTVVGLYTKAKQLPNYAVVINGEIGKRKGTIDNIIKKKGIWLGRKIALLLPSFWPITQAVQMALATVRATGQLDFNTQRRG